MPDDRAEINRGIDEAVCVARGFDKRRVEMLTDGRVHVPDERGEISVRDYCSSLDAGIEACGVLGLGLNLSVRNTGAEAEVFKIGSDPIFDQAWEGFDKTPALALARAVLEAVK